jgi:hypothetical protein
LDFLDGKQPKAEPVIADRSTVQRWATCPQQANLYETLNTDCPSELADIGKEVHRIIEETLRTGVEQQIPADELAGWVCEELPKARPDIQPQVIKAAKWVADEIANLAVGRIIGVEHQIDYLSDIKIDGRPVMLTCCLDLLLGGNNSLIVIDWKSGYKKRSNADTQNDFQAQFGAYILWKMYPEVKTVHWFFMETLWGSKSYARFDRDFELPSLPHLTTELQIQGRIFEALKLWQQKYQDAWPEPKKCMYCDCISKCKYAHAEALDVAIDPTGFMDRFVVLSALVDKYHDEAVAYIRGGKSLKGTKTVFEWRPATQKFTPKVYKLNGNGDGDEDS